MFQTHWLYLKLALDNCIYPSIQVSGTITHSAQPLENNDAQPDPIHVNCTTLWFANPF